MREIQTFKQYIRENTHPLLQILDAMKQDILKHQWMADPTRYLEQLRSELPKYNVTNPQDFQRLFKMSWYAMPSQVANQYRQADDQARDEIATQYAATPFGQQGFEGNKAYFQQVKMTIKNFGETPKASVFKDED